MSRPEKTLKYPKETAYCEALNAFDWATAEREKALKNTPVNNPHRHTVDAHWAQTIKHFKERMRVTKPFANIHPKALG